MPQLIQAEVDQQEDEEEEVEEVEEDEQSIPLLCLQLPACPCTTLLASSVARKGTKQMCVDRVHAQLV
jgi:hypothetical protein